MEWNDEGNRWGWKYTMSDGENSGVMEETKEGNGGKGGSFTWITEWK